MTESQVVGNCSHVNVCLDVFNQVAHEVELTGSLYICSLGTKNIKLEGHSVERIYLRQRSSDSSVRTWLALAARCKYIYVGFSPT